MNQWMIGRGNNSRNGRLIKSTSRKKIRASDGGGGLDDDDTEPGRQPFT